MDKSIEELFDEKTKVVLNLIRTNSTADDVLKITQGLRNIVDAKSVHLELTQGKPPKKQGSNA